MGHWPPTPVKHGPRRSFPVGGSAQEARCRTRRCSQYSARCRVFPGWESAPASHGPCHTASPALGRSVLWSGVWVAAGGYSYQLLAKPWPRNLLSKRNGISLRIFNISVTGFRARLEIAHATLCPVTCHSHCKSSVVTQDSGISGAGGLLLNQFKLQQK